jgi:GT2 family glycosyltransferase
MKKVSVIIVNYNVCYFLEQTLRSVQKALRMVDGEVFVVDNNSVDGSVEMVKAKFPEVKLIVNQENTGFSRANNQAIRLAQGQYVLLLNPDTVIQEDTLKKCCDFMDHQSDAGGLGVYMVDGKGNYLPESKRGLPTPWVAFYKIIGLSKLFPKSQKFGRYHLGFLDRDLTHEIEVLSGAFMFLRKEALDKVGLLDEDYFMYGEDIDLSYRITKGGYKNIYFPESRIIHYKGESTKKSTVNYVLMFYGAMIIFAKKHFTGTYAGIFSFVIQMAIYARAVASVAVRIAKRMALPFLHFIVIFLGIAFIKSYWQDNFKYEPGTYPPHYLYVIVPIYITTWLVAVFYSGGFDKPYKTYRVLRGILLGTLIISAVSNFIDPIRFSKAIIILGAVWASSSIIAIRYLIHFIRFGKFDFEESTHRKVIVVGSFQESNRVINLMKNNSIKADTLGFISTELNEAGNENYLGTIKNISDIVRVYRPDEVIFCSKNMAAGQIIELMSRIDNRLVDYKMVPDDSNFIIGSNSKDTQGDLYTVEVHLAIMDRNNVRNKRVLDLFMGLLFLITTPFIIWFVNEPSGFLGNILNVILGKKSLVGFASKDRSGLPKMRPGVLTPISEFELMNLNHQTIRRLDLIYAKDYKTSTDFNIIFGSFRLLGNIN